MSIALFALCAALGASDRSPRPRIAVLDFAAVDIGAKLAANVTQLVASELAKAHPQTGGDATTYETISREDIVAMIDVEKQKLLIGQSSGASLAQLGGLLDARFVVAGTVSKLGSVLVVNAQMIDSRRGLVVGRVVRRYANEDLLTADVRGLVKELLAESATLHLYNQTAGAQVFVDDKLIGAMPLPPTPLKLSGRYRVRAESPDHVPWEAEVKLEPGQTTRLRVDLERIDELEAKSRARKYWAAGTFVLGAGAAAGSVVLFVLGVATKRTYDALDPSTVTQTQLNDLAARGRGEFAGGYVLAGAAAALVATGIYLLVVDPYKASLQVGGGKLALAPRGFGLSW